MRNSNSISEGRCSKQHWVKLVVGDDAVQLASACHNFFDQHGFCSAVVVSLADMVGSDSSSEEALDETYDADPELRLVLQFRVSIREAR